MVTCRRFDCTSNDNHTDISVLSTVACLGTLLLENRGLQRNSGGQSYSNLTVQNADCRRLFSGLENNDTIVVTSSFACRKQWSAVVCILHFVLTVILIYSICEHQEQEPTILIVCSQCALSTLTMFLYNLFGTAVVSLCLRYLLLLFFRTYQMQ